MRPRPVLTRRAIRAAAVLLAALGGVLATAAPVAAAPAHTGHEPGAIAWSRFDSDHATARIVSARRTGTVCGR